MSHSEAWYIVKQASGHCTIQPGSQENATEADASANTLERWGPYASQADAIARRVGLIRAGKCNPV